MSVVRSPIKPEHFDGVKYPINPNVDLDKYSAVPPKHLESSLLGTVSNIALSTLKWMAFALLLPITLPAMITNYFVAGWIFPGANITAETVVEGDKTAGDLKTEFLNNERHSEITIPTVDGHNMSAAFVRTTSKATESEAKKLVIIVPEDGQNWQTTAAKYSEKMSDAANILVLNPRGFMDSDSCAITPDTLATDVFSAIQFAKEMGVDFKDLMIASSGSGTTYVNAGIQLAVDLYAALETEFTPANVLLDPVIDVPSHQNELLDSLCTGKMYSLMLSLMGWTMSNAGKLEGMSNIRTTVLHSRAETESGFRPAALAAHLDTQEAITNEEDVQSAKESTLPKHIVMSQLPKTASPAEIFTTAAKSNFSSMEGWVTIPRGNNSWIESITSWTSNMFTALGEGLRTLFGLSSGE